MLTIPAGESKVRIGYQPDVPISDPEKAKEEGSVDWIVASYDAGPDESKSNFTVTWSS